MGFHDRGSDFGLKMMTWEGRLAQSEDHVTQGPEFKPYVGCGAYLQNLKKESGEWETRGCLWCVCVPKATQQHLYSEFGYLA